MAKGKRQPRKRTTTKRVQETENLPPPKKPGDVPLDFPPEADEEPVGDDGLTEKQRAFCIAYVGPAGFNASKAARMAGYRAENIHSLKSTACENLTKPYIQRTISRLIADKRGDRDWVRAGLVELANTSMADFMRVGSEGAAELDMEKAVAAGALGQVKEISEEVLRTTGDGPQKVVVLKRKLKLYDRRAALSDLAKIHGMIGDGKGATVNVSVTQMSRDELVRIATSGGEGSASPRHGAGVAGRLRQRD